MAVLNLSGRIAELVKTVKDPRILALAAEAMAEEMKTATARYIGADLRMHNFPGAAAQITSGSTATEAIVTMRGGTYALADKGRRQARRARARRGSALDTPWGPKRSVRGSTWPGFGITDKHAADAFDAGIEAITAALAKVSV